MEVARISDRPLFLAEESYFFFFFLAAKDIFSRIEEAERLTVKRDTLSWEKKFAGFTRGNR